MGVMGISYADFCRLTPEAFGECAKAWNDVETERQRQHWERMRMLATITVQPHSKKRLQPRKMLPFPWDAKPQKKETPQLTREQRRDRFYKLCKKIELKNSGAVFGSTPQCKPYKEASYNKNQGTDSQQD